MKITRGLAAHQRVPHPVLTIGNFDGQHLGHRVLLRDVVRRANEAGGTPMVLTFDPHPVKVLAPHADLRFLTMPDEKLAYFRDAGIAEVLVLEFTTAFAALTPDQFMQQVLRDGVGVKDLFVGEHFAFGKGRVGRTADLVRFGLEAGFQVHPVQPLRADGEVVSSTRIRQRIQGGAEAAAGPGDSGGRRLRDENAVGDAHLRVRRVHRDAADVRGRGAAARSLAARCAGESVRPDDPRGVCRAGAGGSDVSQRGRVVGLY